MHTSLLVVDGLYTNADEVRAFILQQPFELRGKYPGLRTVPHVTESLKKTLQDLVNQPITYWPEERDNGAFQITTAADLSWIHHDHTTWGGVLYLTPDPPPSAGTAFFRHRETGIEHEPGPDDAARLGMSLSALSDVLHGDAYRPEAWIKIDEVANRYNRLVLFRGHRWHRSMDYFGSGVADGRLIQNFFFSTE